MQKVRTIITGLLLAASMQVSAQQQPRFLKGNCTPDIGVKTTADSRNDAPKRPLSLKKDWDAERTYPVAVFLVAFTDMSFNVEDPKDKYQRMLNENGYNEGKGPGCTAEYFREQSGGLFKPQFDVYGPVTVSASSTSNSSDEYGRSVFSEAIKKLSDSLSIDFTPYDWNGDGRAEHIVIIYAGYGGNESVNEGKGYIWPNTSSFSTIRVGNIRVADYSASAERWSNNKSCGIGTICHEYSHTLGLPDLYPTSSNEYSVVDEWDLMDGGNFVNNGWCPPNYSAHEKMLLGWMTPEELVEPTSITALKPVAQGGKAYIIRTENSNEFYIMENRQWNGWDLRTPGHGLLISHVDFSSSAWLGNTVNNMPSHHRYELVHADNLDYNAWDAIVGDTNPHVGGHSRILSGSPYPYVSEDAVNNELTDTSVPAATTFSGTGLLGKPITDISEDEEGAISFNFLIVKDAIASMKRSQPEGKSVEADILGRWGGSTRHTVIVGSDGRKTLKKK